MMDKIFYPNRYESPKVEYLDFGVEGVLCSSPVDPGFGGNEDMEEGDDL